MVVRSLIVLLPIFICCLLDGVRGEENLSESEMLDKVFKFFTSDDTTFLKSAQEMLPVFTFLARVQLELAENLNAIDPDLMQKFNVFSVVLNRMSNHDLFQKIVRTVDAQQTHLKLAGTMNVMRRIEEQRQVLLKSGDPTNLDLVEKFDDAYDEGMVIITDALFASMYNRHGQGDQLFKVATKVLHRHPRLSLYFMRSCVQLLLHAFVLEATHLQVTGQPEAKAHAFDRRAKERMDLVIKSVFAIYKSLWEDIGQQISTDQRRLHEANVGMEHCDFAKMFVGYLSDKYPHLSCFVQSYEPVSSFAYHNVLVYKEHYGSILFREGKRNSVVDCRETKALRGDFSRLGKEALELVRRKRKASSDYARRIFNDIKSALTKTKLQQVTITVIRAYAQGCYFAPYGHTATAMKKTYKCNTDLCWIKKSYDFKVVLFG